MSSGLRAMLDRYGVAAPTVRRFRLPRIGLRCTVALSVMAHAVILVVAYWWFTHAH